MNTSLSRIRGIASARFLPQAKPSPERIRVVTHATTLGQLFQFSYVAAAKNHVVRFEGGDQAAHNVRYMTPPFLFSSLLQASFPYVIFIGSLLVREVGQFHRLEPERDYPR